MSKRISWLAVVAVLLGAAQASAYTYTNLGSAGGWKSNPVPVVIDVSKFTTDVSSNSVDLALQNAFDIWADADTNDKLAFNRKDDNGGNYDVFDTYPTTGSLDQSADWKYADITIGGWLPKSYFDSVDVNGGNHILAVTWSAKLRAGGKPAWTSDLFFNDNFTWSDRPDSNPDLGVFDIETVALHELGHAIGFGHETVKPSIMAPYYAGVNRSLSTDDLAGLAALYGGGSGGGGGGGGRGNGGGKGKNKLEADILELELLALTYDDVAGYGHFTISASQAVPEPTTLVSALVGLLSLALCGRRRNG